MIKSSCEGHCQPIKIGKHFLSGIIPLIDSSDRFSGIYLYTPSHTDDGNYNTALGSGAIRWDRESKIEGVYNSLPNANGRLIGVGTVYLTEDTICMPISQAKKILIAATEKKSLDTLVFILSERINEKDSIISLLKSTNRFNEIIINTMTDQRHIMETELAVANKQLKKEKRKKLWTSIGGIVGIGAAFWLGLSL